MNEHAAPRRPATYQDVLDAPANMVAELVGGALHLHPRPAPRHVNAGSLLGMELGGPFSSRSRRPRRLGHSGRA